MGHSYILPADGLITRHNMCMWLISRLLNTQLCMMAKYWLSSYHKTMIHFKVKILKIILLALLKLWSFTQTTGMKVNQTQRT